MAFTTAQLDGLESAIASGRLEVRYDGKHVKYQTTAELIRARDVVKADLQARGLIAPIAGTNRGPSSLASFDRDL